MLSGLGLVTVVAGGTPQALASVGALAKVQRVRLQAHEDNAAAVYVGLSNMVAATGVGVLGVIGIPAAAGDPTAVFDIGASGVPVGVDLASLYIDGATGEGVYVTYV
jgi:hypothetical protein